jgi:ABC-type sulfate transport system permease subunit
MKRQFAMQQVGSLQNVSGKLQRRSLQLFLDVEMIERETKSEESFDEMVLLMRVVLKGHGELLMSFGRCDSFL